MSPFFLVLLIVAVASARSPPAPIRDCGPNAVWGNCASPCPITCDSKNEPMGMACPAICISGCTCQEGFIKRSKDSVECILPENC